MSVQAMTWVWQHSKATEGSLLVLLALADHAHPDGTHAYPSVATLAKMARLSERTVQYALRDLVKIGEIATTRQGGGRGNTTEYTIVAMQEKGAVVAPLASERVQEKGATTAPLASERVQPTTERVQLTTERVQPVAPEPINPKNPSMRARAREDAPRHIIDQVIDSIKETTGRTVSREWARTVADHITGGRTLNDPAAYTRQAIENEPRAVQRFLPTPIPPRVDRRAVADARAHRTPSEAKTELIAATRQKLRTTMAPSSPF